jgi:hypothetical protein
MIAFPADKLIEDMDDPHQQARAAFNRALRTGRLVEQVGAANYVGDYMFMGFKPNGIAAFKNRNTREYLK